MRRTLPWFAATPMATPESGARRDPDLAPDPDAPPSRSARHAGPARVLATLALIACIAAGFGGSADRGEHPSGGTVPAAATAAAVRPAAANVSTTVAGKAVVSGPEGARRPGATQLAALQLVAHVEMARTALAADLVSAARQHVGEALPLASRLVYITRAQPPGNGAASSSPREAWIALQNEEHLVHTPADPTPRDDGTPVAAADARAVRTRRSVDAARVLASLGTASRALAAGDTHAASGALDAAAGSVFAETSVRDLPLQRVEDDLDLAQRLAAAGDDDGAGEALDYARAALADAELGDVALAHTSVAAGLRRRIDGVETRLAAREPAGVAKLYAAASRGLHAFGRWLQAAHAG
jgi:hypothetical protein